MKHKIGVYLRVSTEEQALAQEGSLDSQRHRLLSFVDIKNVQEPGWGKIAEIYSDEGISAKDTRRPAFQRMMSDIRKGRVNLILVTDLSRLSRNLLDFCVLLNDLKTFNAKFLSMKEQFDTSTAAGEMMVFNVMNLAQFERKQTSERVSINFHSRAMRGLRNGASTVLGYDIDESNRSRLVVNKTEAKRVEEIFKVFLKTGTLAQTLRELRARGIAPKARTKELYRLAKSGQWSRSSLLILLRNPIYIGLKEVNKKNNGVDQENLKPWERYQVVKGSWSSILDEVTFNRVQKMLDMTLGVERTRLENGIAKDYPLTRLISCKYCLKKLVGASAKSSNTKSYRYYDHKTDGIAKVSCLVKRHPAEELENMIFNHLMSELTQSKYLDGLWESSKIETREKRVFLEGQKRLLQEKISELEISVRNVIQMNQRMKGGSVASATLEEELEALGRQKNEFRTSIQMLENDILDLDDPSLPRREFETAVEEIKRGHLKAAPAIKKRLLRRLFKAILVSVDGLELYYRMDAGEEPGDTLKTKKIASEFSSEASGGLSNELENPGAFALHKGRVKSSSIVLNGAG